MRTRRPLAHPRGFTLAEILVGSVVGTIVLAGIVAAFAALQTSVSSHSGSKLATETGRAAMQYLERTVRYAGYGLDPRIAFDFDATALASTTCTATNKKNNCTAAASGTVHAYTTDDLAFRYRDPSWMRRGHFASGSYSLSLEGGSTFGMEIKSGKRLMVSCVGGLTHVVVQTSATAAATANAVATTVDTALKAAGTTPESCLTATGGDAPFVTVLREVRLRVVDGNLVAFYNLTDSTLASADVAPVAQGVEDFQVSYVMNRPDSGGTPPDSAGNGNWIFGDAANDGLPSTAVTAPLFDTPYNDALRQNAHPANIRGVRLSLVIWATAQDKGGQVAPQSLEDHAVAATNDGRFRIRLQTTVSLPNMLSRSFFNPPIGKTLVSGG